jgi:large subunit ribosomal protein L25
METAELACEKRPDRPKNLARALRRQGRVPAIMYGPRTTPTAITVDGAELKSKVSSAAQARIIRLKSATAELDGKHVIFKDLQRAPVSGDILHADFYEVDLNKPLRLEVALKFVGKAKGVANGGILQPLERSVLVECLPLEIPESLEIDVTEVDVHDVVHVSSIKFAGNVKPIFDTDYPIVTVLPPTVAEVPVVAAAAEGAVEGAAPAEGAAAPAAEGGKEAPAAAPEKAGDKGGAKK